MQARARLLTFLMAMGLAVSPPDAARAIVGSNRDGAAFSDRVVMILTRGPQGSGFCTGVVLAPRVVLTAAHCLRPASDMLVHFRDDAGAPVFIPVEASQAHPRYRPEAMTARVVSIDLGLIETQRPLPPSFRAVGLSQVDRPPIGSSATVVGFGVGREGTSKSGGVLRAVTLAVREPASQILLWAGIRHAAAAHVRAIWAARYWPTMARRFWPSSRGQTEPPATNAATLPRGL